MKKIAIFLLTSIISAGSSLAQSSPMKVQQGSEYVSGWNRVVKYVYIQSTENNLVITRVVLNRGNCQTMLSGYSVPVSLKYGDTLKAIVDHCNVLEVDVQTNKGNFTYKF